MKTQTKGWVVMTYSHPNYNGLYIRYDSFSKTRKDAINKFMDGMPKSFNWWAENYGYKCVRATQTIEIDHLPDTKKTI